MAAELISIRECARRLGVSDTAVHKAIKAGRVKVHSQTPSGRPLLEWPQAQADYSANSDSTKRTHIGSTGANKRRDNDKAPAGLPLRADVLSGAAVAPETLGAGQPTGTPAVGGPSFAQSKARREAYMALIAKLDYEARVGKLVPADEVALRWGKLVAAAKNRILGIPASCKMRVADLPISAVAVIDEICRQALDDLANEKS